MSNPSMGAKVLDRLYPNWYKVIDLNTFDVFIGDWCVLGQLSPSLIQLNPEYNVTHHFNGYADCLDSASDFMYRENSVSRLSGEDRAHRMFVRLGFNPSGDDVERVQAEWITEIRSRRELSNA